MITKLHTYEVRCDECGHSLRLVQATMPPPPTGWTRVSVGPCGATDYFREELRCPTCSQPTAVLNIPTLIS